MPRPRKDANRDEIADIFDDVTIDLSRAIGPQVYDLLRLKIIFSELPPGTKINEHELASRLGISRTPVREAYQKLADDNLIVSRPQVGSIVAPLDDERVSEGIVIRRALELEVIKKLCEQGDDLQRIEPVLALQKVAVEQDDYFTFFNLDEQFHALLAELAGIPAAWRLAHSVKAHADIARLSLSRSIPGRIKVAFNEHLQLIEAIGERDTNRAQSIIVAHINSVFEIGTIQ
jgi:DNA-binding GntR family transcriptional regulator